MNVAFYTLGCKVNHYETQAMAGLFEDAGYSIVPFGSRADVYIVNTCTVTATGDQKSRQILQRAHRRNPDALIVAAGCYAQVSPNEVSALPGVSLLVGQDGRSRIVSLVEQALASRAGGKTPLIAVPDMARVTAFDTLSAVRDGRTRATLKIQDGCRNFCTYCIIPYARGLLRSRPMADIERQLRLLADEGFLEVVLTGIHLASYGLDFPPEQRADLLDALRLACSVPGIARVRLGSLEPGFVDDRFVSACAALPALCRQFHLSLQSGSDTVLARMNRRYTTAEYARAVALLREAMPDCAITTDVIAGFPGETEREHAESLAFVEQMAFSRIHVFPYSRRSGTAAARMPGQLPNAVKQARARAMIALGEALEREYLAGMVGRTVTVLVERSGEGYSGNYIRIKTNGSDGALITCRITSVENDIAYGEETKADGSLYLL